MEQEERSTNASRCTKTCIRLVHVPSAQGGFSMPSSISPHRHVLPLSVVVEFSANQTGLVLASNNVGKTFTTVHLKSERDMLKGYISHYGSAVSSQYLRQICRPTFPAAFQGDSGSLPGAHLQRNSWWTSLSKRDTGIALSCSNSAATPQSYQ